MPAAGHMGTPDTEHPSYHCEGIAAEADLGRFEKHLTAYDVPRTRWAVELLTLLQGDLTSIALSISTDQAGCYSTPKKAILTRLGITQSARFSGWLDPNSRSSETLPGLPLYPGCCPYLSQRLQQHRRLRYSNHAGSCLPPAATVGGTGGTVRTGTEATYGTGHGPDAWVAEGKFDHLTTWKSHTTWKGPRPLRPSDCLLIIFRIVFRIAQGLNNETTPHTSIPTTE